MIKYSYEKIIPFLFNGVLYAFRPYQRHPINTFALPLLLCCDAFYQTSLAWLGQQPPRTNAKGKRKSSGGKTARARLLHCRAQKNAYKIAIFHAKRNSFQIRLKMQFNAYLPRIFSQNQFSVAETNSPAWSSKRCKLPPSVHNLSK